MKNIVMVFSIIIMMGCYEAPLNDVVVKTDTITQTIVEKPLEEQTEPLELKPEVLEPEVVIELVRGFQKNPYTNSSYDDWFKKYSNQYLPFRDWKWLKAQCIQESALNPTAVSWAGAKGLCQFMDATWRDMQNRLSFGTNITQFNEEVSIRSAAFYMRSLNNSWISDRTASDRLKLSQACYNAGCGSIQKAQKICGMVNDYDGIIKCLVDVTGERNSHETRDYVQKIAKHYGRLNMF